MERYQDRKAAGKYLVHYLAAYANDPNLIILALPRGGVPVAYEVASALKVPLDVFIVRKLGVPGHSELAMGAIALGGMVIFNEGIIQNFAIEQDEINAVIAKEQAELTRRALAYRNELTFPSLTNKTIILVDDGIATGASIRAAIAALKQLKPVKLIVAVPVADKTVCREIASLVDDFICPLQPISLQAVGIWYEDFSQTEDEEVRQLLNQHKAALYNRKDRHA